MFKTKADYRAAWEQSYHSDPEIPLNLDLELASTCNLACKFCKFGESEFNAYLNTKDWDGKSIRRFMPLEMALSLLDEADRIGIPAVKLNFRGESTLHPQFAKIAQYARSCNFYEVLSNTNANSPVQALDGLMACTKVMVSLDSCDPEMYPKVRVGGNMDKAFFTIRELKKRGHSDLWIRRVICKENQHEDFVGSVKRIFGEDTKVSEHFAFDRNKEYSGCVHDFAPEDWERTFCGYPSQRAVVTASGEYLPCCISWGGELKMGTIYQMNLMQYWNSEKRKTLARELRLGIFKNEICKNCTSFLSYRRPERKYVQDIEGKAVI